MPILLQKNVDFKENLPKYFFAVNCGLLTNDVPEPTFFELGPGRADALRFGSGSGLYVIALSGHFRA